MNTEQTVDVNVRNIITDFDLSKGIIEDVRRRIIFGSPKLIPNLI